MLLFTFRLFKSKLYQVGWVLDCPENEFEVIYAYHDISVHENAFGLKLSVSGRLEYIEVVALVITEHNFISYSFEISILDPFTDT